MMISGPLPAHRRGCEAFSQNGAKNKGSRSLTI
uniref:Uncharacterized protein n=1 Tax=Anguilla anguilla TaxID=7936 RepID=A0A0E9U3T0_ANGAN